MFPFCTSIFFDALADEKSQNKIKNFIRFKKIILSFRLNSKNCVKIEITHRKTIQAISFNITYSKEYNFILMLFISNFFEKTSVFLSKFEK